MFSETLVNMFKAGVPAVQISTAEEQRCCRDIIAILEAKDGKDCVILWSLTQGYHKFGQGKIASQPTDTYSGLTGIDEVREQYILFHDMDEEVSPGNPFYRLPEVRRKLKDILPILENSDKKLIFITKGYMDIPEVLKVDYELPDAKSLKEILMDIEASVIQATDGKISMSKDKRERAIQEANMVKSAQGLTAYEAKNAFSLAIIKERNFGDRASQFVQKMKAEQISNNGVLEYYEPNYTLKDMGGSRGLVEYLTKRKKLFTEQARSLGLPRPKGVIITGITGTGKSLTAKITSSLYGLPLVRLNVGAIFGGIVGESEKNLRKAIKQIEAMAPVILWIDEIDKAFSGIKSGQTGSDVPQRLFGELLTWFTESKKEVFKVATCNNILVLPPEITNRTRFDEVFFIDLPTESERMDVARIHLEKNGQKFTEKDIKIFAKETDGYTPSEIEQIVYDALIGAYYETDKAEVRIEHILESVKSIKPVSQIMKDDIDRLRQYAKDRFRPANTVSEPQAVTQKRKLNV